MNYMNINLPDPVEAELCFIKKVNRQEQYYEFHRADIKINVSKRLGEWLRENFENLKRINEQNITPYDPEADVVCSFLNLEEIKDKWEEFEGRAFTLTDHDGRGFREIEKFKAGYIIYTRIQGKVYGQINKISDSYILPEPKWFFLTMAFDEIIPEKGVKLIKEPDILFYPAAAPGEKEFIIFDNKNFELLFDYQDYKKIWAKQFLAGISDLFVIDITDETILEELLDKNVINMLNKPIIKVRGEYNREPAYLQDVLNSYSSLKYRIEGGKAVLPADKKERKQAFIDVMKALSFHYAQTFDEKPLEVNPIRLMG